MTKNDKTQMDKHYNKQVKAGLITNIDGALGYKLGYEKAFSLNSVSQQRELLFAYERIFINENRYESNEDIYKRVYKFLGK